MSELTNDEYIHRLEEDNAILKQQLKTAQDLAEEATKLYNERLAEVSALRKDLEEARDFIDSVSGW